MAERPERTKVMVIDDDEDVLDMIRYLLEAEGFEAVTALDGRAGLELVAATGPSLILLDLKMPVMDGPAFVEAYRRSGGTTPIVVVTAADDARKRAAEVGAAGWLAKPFTTDDLLAVVRRHAGPPR
jgi:DNA-binding response OmpR family regulator